ncbi:MAG: 1,2-phenylacetyl-CoA epoxidase subunit PaaE [Burkholderiales bacterium]
MTPRFHPLRIAEIRRECPDAISLRFEVPEPLLRDYVFVQGQHVTLKATVAGEEVRRSYSICSGIDDGELRVAIRAVPGGVFSNWATRTLAVGDTLEVMTPDGRFHTSLDPARARHYVAFAAGSGITPILSLIKTTLKREPRSRFTLIYGNRSTASTLFLEDLEDLKDRYLRRFVLHTVFSREPQDIELFHGRLDGPKVRIFLAALVPVATIDEVFVCGPGEMIDTVAQTLAEAGVPEGHVHVERFGVPSGAATNAPAPEDAPQAVIEIELDGVRRDVAFRSTDASVLDAALRAGLDLPYSCKGGMCCTCRAKLLGGKVRMAKNYSLDPADVAAGYILTCQSHPLTERLAVSFDVR